MLYRYPALINMNARLFMCNFKPLDLRTIITQKHPFLCALLLLIVEQGLWGCSVTPVLCPMVYLVSLP